MLATHVTLSSEEGGCFFHVEVTFFLVSVPAVVLFLDQLSEKSFEVELELGKLEHEVD